MRIVSSIKTIAALLKDLRSMKPREKAEFYKAKCEYYQGIVELGLLVACITTIFFIYSDYMINGSFIPTLIPRLSILVFIAIFFIVTHFSNNSRTMVVMDFFLGHGMVIAASWTAYNLVDNSNSITGIIIVNILWLVIGYVSTPMDTTINGIIFVCEIFITNIFNHYISYEQIISLEIPIITGIIFVQYIMTAFFLDRYRISQKLEEAMITDPLTQVYNRHVLEKIRTENILEKIPSDEPISVAMLDIDDFKKINDENGHYTGDITLFYIGQKLSKDTHEGEYVIRYGGEEFVIIFRNCDIDTARDRMEKFRTEIENANDTPVPFTISVGVSAYTGDYTMTLRTVDSALYEAKNTGKNRVVVK